MSFHYAAGQWVTLFTTAPAGGSGVPLPDGSRFVVQAAKVTTDNADNSPAPTWVDITSKVNRLDWLTGDPSGAISRWIIEQFTLTCADLTGVLGDFVDLTGSLTSTAPQAGMFARWGFLRADGSWSPMQSGIVETLEEIIGGRVRGWRLRAFGTLLYMAKVVPANGVIDLGGVGTDLVVACNNLLATNGFTASIIVAWPWSQSIGSPAQSNFPITTSVGTLTGTQLGGLHRLADTMGMRVVNTPTGGVLLEPWGATVASGVRLSDEPSSPVIGHAPIAGTVTGTPTWKRSPDKCGPNIDMATSDGTTGRTQGDELLFTKWGWRSDIVGFPKNDLLGQGIRVIGGASTNCIQKLTEYAAPLVVRELRLERIDCDTAQDAQVWQLLTGAAPLWTRSTPWFERRRPGTTWLEAQVFVSAVAGSLEFATGVGHAVTTYYTRLV